MEKKIVIVKLDISGTMGQIRQLKTEDDLFSYSRKLRIYRDIGLIKIPDVIRDGLHRQLDRIYKN
ncbi:hypothetical protein [Chryseobacterium caseinilyticum]|uniref:Uncharacterized protein n=1 Tax=Chryseobacterium caseinilyticum TaxID=2771428 RepID=A0ABR8Z714_9FLAO|nr:hypothetical protein [Chryseobacterium caseinilyticum]MBD8081095.1 hypothetical protein [Chryseobacterium caseinilyticum]